jgi:radical SAM protein with 4Fe4S-binding SPASM domain
VILTRRCNLRCAHCYLGEAENQDLAPELAVAVATEFEAVQGLRLLLSGGEPLLYPHWDRLAPALAGRGYRVVLLTNGQALDRERLLALPVDEVQLSLDGLGAGHEALRGKGTFTRALAAARLVRELGRDLSVATMIHTGNIDEMEGLEELVRELGAREWSLDVPAEAGRWARESGPRAAPLAQAAAAMARGFGGSYHGSSEGFACGRHLAAVLPDGWLAPCGFYGDDRLGRVEDGLDAAWARKQHRPLVGIAGCAACGAAADCAGGCRFRAETMGSGGPDPVMCAVHLDCPEKMSQDRD